MMFDLPPYVEAGALGRNRLIHGVKNESAFVILAPGLGPLKLAEDIELHAIPLLS